MTAITCTHSYNAPCIVQKLNRKCQKNHIIVFTTDEYDLIEISQIRQLSIGKFFSHLIGRKGYDDVDHDSDWRPLNGILFHWIPIVASIRISICRLSGELLLVKPFLRKCKKIECNRICHSDNKTPSWLFFRILDYHGSAFLFILEKKSLLL